MPSTSAEDPVYRPKEASAYLGISRSAFFRLISAKRLPEPIRYSARTVVYRKSTLDAFIKSCEVQA